MSLEHSHLQIHVQLKPARALRRDRKIWAPFGVALLAGLSSAAPAYAIDKAGFQRVMAGLAKCEQTQSGPQVNVCVAGAIDGAGFKLVESGPVVPQTVADVRAAPNKAAAVSVLNRARSVVQGLAAKTSGFAQESYGRMGQIYARAIDVINRKG
jgi:hypothetical protein